MKPASTLRNHKVDSAVMQAMKHDTVTPYGDQGSKKEQVSRMFDAISARYDFLNHFFSAGIDHLWRKKGIALLSGMKHPVVLDVATGTGDFAFAAMKLHPKQVVGIDISKGMLEKGREKIAERGLGQTLTFIEGDSESLPFDDAHFDAITVGFGVRNFEHLTTGLEEMHRVLKKGGQLVVLEFSKPKRFPFKQIYFAYFRWIMPAIGKLVSRDKSAYRYLPASVMAFPEGDAFTELLRKAGFAEASAQPLTGGIATLYHARK